MAVDPSPEWLRVRRSIDNADGFALYFVFTDWPAQIRAGQDYLAESLKLRTLRLRTLAPADPALLVTESIAALLGAPAGTRQPLWLECWRDAGNADWQGARRQLLARLNEGRGRLEKEFAAPLILLLPRDAVAQTAETAPDLWSIRRLTLHLSRPSGEGVPTVMATHEEMLLPVPTAVAERAARRLQAWQRQMERNDSAALSLPDAWSAVDSLREAGRLTDAGQVADEALIVARNRRDESTPETLRDLSVSLDKVGDVARDLGDLDAARAVYEESLALRQQLRSALGDTPQALRDLSVSQQKIADLAARIEAR